ncbi:MAG: hypothetical protein A2418_01990 [Candidatus Brennerbacteria bacterium RIFOXYC1_FULL_41_11]|uniref:PrgI family protein n=1 Tax=Candidatus Brennerbacteria bacterium RIFOXYD1_FULL_41_16 TaxID=1797529 RepID=A0A1G1XKV7_9BACT|nr:MAG: hypothetical protein A2391_01345 [Candidatus Brennerbacteria bacterium RIFOXYB1_FULL_41_13]OGY39922.1 MAG: hypothetical protein A2418_01990 [Candidatus Brennerbacteria bacterium RIFOXYC1_FULL_41_11]OGY40733.1 MAG: hypothetical protein A2570_01205 [Candidatus Brennerbacteria bacterium RIFOXYD1_FULL_41_16]
MQFELPRYIEEEAKILGPLNVKQFMLMFAGVITCALFFFFFKTWLAVILSFVLMGSAVFLMFGKIQGREAYTVVFAAVKYVWQPKSFVWKKEGFAIENVYYEKERKVEQKQAAPVVREAKIMSLEEIRDLAKKLDETDQAISEEELE